MKEFNEEMLDKELEELVGSMPEQDQLEKNIERKIKKKIQRTATRTVAALVGIVIVLLLIINPIMNAVFPNPLKSGEMDEETLVALRSYWETKQPYIEPVGYEAQKKGFGRYEMVLEMYNHRGQFQRPGSQVFVELNCGKYKLKEDVQGYTSILLNRFQCDWNEKEDYIKKIKELPQSSVVYLSVGAKKPRNVEELRNESVKLEWVEIYQPNVEFQGGLNMWLCSAWNKTDATRDTMNMEELKEVYLSNLENILEHSEIMHSFGLDSGNTIFTELSMDQALKACYEDAKKLETLESKNYCISGKRDEIVDYLERTDVNSLMVDEIKLSELSK